MKLFKPLLLVLLLTLPAFGQFGSNATKLRGKNLCNPLTPASGTVLVWNATNNCWGAGADSATAAATRKALGVSYLAYATTAQNIQNLVGTAVDLTASSYTIPGGSIGNNGIVRLSFVVTMVGASSKTLQASFGSCAISQGAGATAGDWWNTPLTWQNDPGIQTAQHFNEVAENFGASGPLKGTTGTCTVNTAADMIVKLNVICATCTAGDSITLKQYSIEILPVVP